MFNAAFLKKEDTATTTDTFENILSGKDFLLDSMEEDDDAAVFLKAVDGQKVSMLRFRTGAQRVGLEAAVIPGDEGMTLLYFSVYPLMQHFDLPAIQGISESRREHEEHEEMCRFALEAICDSVTGKMSGVSEVFRNIPLSKRYSIAAADAPSITDMEETIITLLKKLGFEVIRIGRSGSRREVHIKAMNRTRLHAIREVFRAARLAPLLEKAQRVAAEFTIVPPDEGTDAGMKVSVALYPAMEFLDMEEVHGISDSMDEELTDARVCRDMWDVITAALDEKLETPK